MNSHLLLDVEAKDWLRDAVVGLVTPEVHHALVHIIYKGTESTGFLEHLMIVYAFAETEIDGTP